MWSSFFVETNAVFGIIPNRQGSEVNVIRLV